MLGTDHINIDELTAANAITLAAIVRILEQKGIMSRDEIMDEIKKIRREQEPSTPENTDQ